MSDPIDNNSPVTTNPISTSQAVATESGNALRGSENMVGTEAKSPYFVLGEVVRGWFDKLFGSKAPAIVKKDDVKRKLTVASGAYQKANIVISNLSPEDIAAFDEIADRASHNSVPNERVIFRDGSCFVINGVESDTAKLMKDISESNEKLKTNPGDASKLYSRGKAYFDLMLKWRDVELHPEYSGHFSEKRTRIDNTFRIAALNDLKSAAQIEPDNHNIKYQLGLVNLYSGYTENAKKNFSSARRLFRNSHEKLLMTYYIALTYEDPSEELFVLRSINKLDSYYAYERQVALYIELKDYNKAEAALKKMEILRPVGMKNFYRAQILVADNQPIKAVEYFRKEIETIGSDLDKRSSIIDYPKVEIIRNMAKELFNVKGFQEVVELLEGLLKEPHEVSAKDYDDMARVLTKLHRYEEAEENLKKSVNIEGKVRGKFQRNIYAEIAAMRSDNFDYELKIDNKAIEADSTNKSLRLRRAYLLLKRARIKGDNDLLIERDLQGALNDLDNAITQNGDNPDLFYAKGLVYKQMNNAEKAQEAFNEVKELRSISVAADDKLKTNNIDKKSLSAQDAKNRYGIINYPQGENTRNSVKAHVAAGNYQVALDLLEKSASPYDYGASSKYHNDKAVVLVKLGKYDEAKENLIKSINIEGRVKGEIPRNVNAEIAIMRVDNFEYELEIDNKAIAADPLNDKLLLGRAYLFLRRAIIMGDKDPLREGELNAAMNDLDKAIEYNIDKPDLYYAKGLVYNQLGKYEQANEIFKDVAKLKHNRALNDIPNTSIKSEEQESLGGDAEVGHQQS